MLTAFAVKAGQFDAALSLNDEALKVAPGNEMLHVVRAQILNACGQRTEAIRHLEAFCQSEQGRGSAAARLTLADLHRVNGDFPAAKVWIDRSEPLGQGNPAVFVARVSLLVSQKQFAAVPPLLADYRAKNPDQPVALLMAAGALASSSDQQALQMARGILDELVVAFPNFTDGHIARAEAARQAGELEAAARRIPQCSETGAFPPAGKQRPGMAVGRTVGQAAGSPGDRRQGRRPVSQ